MRGSFLSIILYLILFIIFQNALQYFLLWIGFEGIWLFIVFDLILAFTFAYINYPRIYRKSAFKDSRFHMSVALWFAIFIGMDLLFRL